jgi:hypothetical protein
MRYEPLLLWTIAVSGPAGAATTYLDPMTHRMSLFCNGREACMAKQRRGVQAFLHEITLQPRPTRERIQWCLDRATNKKGLTDWNKAARCIR